MSTICVVGMATYGRTLCWNKRNKVPNTGGVFAVGAISQTMDMTDVKQLRGTPPGVVGACSGPSGAPPVAPVAPWLPSGGAFQYRTRGLIPGPRGSYCSIPSRRWCLLVIVEARLHGEGL